MTRSRKSEYLIAPPSPRTFCTAWWCSIHYYIIYYYNNIKHIMYCYILEYIIPPTLMVSHTYVILMSSLLHNYNDFVVSQQQWCYWWFWWFVLLLPDWLSTRASHLFSSQARLLGQRLTPPEDIFWSFISMFCTEISFIQTSFAEEKHNGKIQTKTFGIVATITTV